MYRQPVLERLRFGRQHGHADVHPARRAMQGRGEHPIAACQAFEARTRQVERAALARARRFAGGAALLQAAHARFLPRRRNDELVSRAHPAVEDRAVTAFAADQPFAPTVGIEGVHEDFAVRLHLFRRMEFAHLHAYHLFGVESVHGRERMVGVFDTVVEGEQDNAGQSLVHGLFLLAQEQVRLSHGGGVAEDADHIPLPAEFARGTADVGVEHGSILAPHG